MAVLPASSAAVRAGFALASAAVHALAFAAVGHSRAPARDAAAEVAVVLREEPSNVDVEPVAPEPTRPTTNATSLAPPPSHTHPYPVPRDHDAHPHDPSLVHLPVPFAAAPASAPAATPETLHAEPSHEPVRFTMSVGNAAAPARGASSSSLPAAEEPALGSDAAPLAEAQVSSPARMIGVLSPEYPAEARAQEVEADVVVMIVVTTTGTVADARVVKPAGFGFDDAVLRALRAARFSPALHDGHPVAVRMRHTVHFGLR